MSSSLGMRVEPVDHEHRSRCSMNCRTTVQKEDKQFRRQANAYTGRIAGLILLISIVVAAARPVLGLAAEPAPAPAAPAVEEWLNQNVRLHDTVQAVDRPSSDGKPSGEIRAGAEVKAIAVLDATGRWQELALIVMQVGYMDDLTYYYLGHAAENLGYLQSAEKYYRIAEQIAVTNMSCHQGEVDAEANLGIPVNECAGYVFPDALYSHLEVVESRLAALSAPSEPTQPHHAKRRVAKRPATPTTASASGSSQAAGSGFVVPTPTAAPAGGSGFVEPAPAPSSSDQFAIPPVRH